MNTRIWFQGEQGPPSEFAADTPARVEGKLMPLSDVPPEIWDLEVYNGSGWLEGNRVAAPVEFTLQVTVKVVSEVAHSETTVCREVGRALLNHMHKPGGDDVLYEVGIIKVVKPTVPLVQPGSNRIPRWPGG